MKTLTQWLLLLSVAVSLVICGCGDDKTVTKTDKPPKKSDRQKQKDESNKKQIEQAMDDMGDTQQ